MFFSLPSTLAFGSPNVIKNVPSMCDFSLGVEAWHDDGRYACSSKADQSAGQAVQLTGDAEQSKQASAPRSMKSASLQSSSKPVLAPEPAPTPSRPPWRRSGLDMYDYVTLAGSRSM
mmetsp:Transcript_6238/g.13661  ORF Transcript_6238/g.13661 Transcript_6238/m.13661 type:complete len:117 (+) Transcript_6238:95-445(+)